MTTDSRRGARLSGRALAVSAVLIVLGVAGSTRAQVLTAEDDDFHVPFGETLVVEAFGVLDNDLLDDESAGENGATAELVTDVSQGTLTLGSYGSFSYSPGPGYDGTDLFVYRAVFGGATAEATVTLSACGGGPQIFTCWKEAAFLAKAAELGHPSFFESFEDDAVWGAARTPLTRPFVSSRGYEWRANDFDPTHVDPPPALPPPPNEITTGSGAARTGQWGIFDREHGYARGVSGNCDTDTPAADCLYHDGWTIRRELGAGPLHGAGGWFDGFYGANVAIVLDGDWANPIGGGKIGVGAHQYFGVIDAGPLGFREIQFRETDGKIGQALLIFGDDFTLLAEPALPVPALGLSGLAVLGGSLAVAGLARGRALSRRR